MKSNDIDNINKIWAYLTSLLRENDILRRAVESKVLELSDYNLCSESTGVPTIELYEFNDISGVIIDSIEGRPSGTIRICGGFLDSTEDDEVFFDSTREVYEFLLEELLPQLTLFVRMPHRLFEIAVLEYMEELKNQNFYVSINWEKTNIAHVGIFGIHNGLTFDFSEPGLIKVYYRGILVYTNYTEKTIDNWLNLLYSIFPNTLIYLES